MKLSDAEKNNRLSEVFLKKSDREYYDLEITEDHQKLYDQYVSGDLNKQDFEEQLNKLIKQPSECLRAIEQYQNFAPAFSLITSFIPILNSKYRASRMGANFEAFVFEKA